MRRPELGYQWVMRRFVLGAIVLLLLLGTRTALAQGNYRSAPTGGRSALMGNTGVALGNDGAAPFLNPATVVRVDSSLALSLNFVSLDITHASNWYVPGQVDAATYGNVPRSSDATITRVSGNAVPSTFCLFFGLPRIGSAKEGHAGRQQLATCLGATERASFDWVGQGYKASSADRSTLQSSSIRTNWQRFVVAPTYAVDVTDSLALGASVHGTFTDYSTIYGVGTTTTGGTLPVTSSAFQSGASGTDFGLSGLFGATLGVGSFTIGASVQTPDLSVYGRGNMNRYVQFASTAETSSTTYVGSGGFHARAPTRFGLGVGYQWSTGTVELDAQLALADGDPLVLDTTGTQVQSAGAAATAARTLTTRYQPAFNAGVGAEVFVRPHFSVLGGFGTDLSAVDSISDSGAAPSQIQRIFWSFGIGSHQRGGTLLLGAQIYYGWGQSLAPNAYVRPPRLDPAGIDTYGMLFVLAGATSLKAIEEAVSAVKGAVAPGAPGKGEGKKGVKR